jgi:predicted small integral membrane protein
VQHKNQTDKNADSGAGFLPIKTNAFDRVFIAIVVFVAIHLLWMRFLELHIPLYAATILSAMIGALIVMRG